MKNIYLILFLTILIFSCKNKETNENFASKETNKEVESSEYLLNATLWVQTSGEYRACCYQAFNYAKIAVENNLKTVKKDKAPAVIFDIDETVIDNSFFEANLIKENTVYTKENWKEWTDMSAACAIPGAIDFLKFLESKNVEIVYITNRKEDEKEASIKNMEKLGFPKIKEENYYSKIEESNKDARRTKVAEMYNIILLVGDNLGDFDSILDQRENDYGFSIVDELREHFGTSFIIMPNPMYGHCEDALYKNKEKSNMENKYDALKGYTQSCLR